MHTCPLCCRDFNSQKGLVAHTEAKHGKANVHVLTQAWENSRGQSNIMTTGNRAEDVGQIYLDEDACYDYDSQTWDCPQCYREFNSFRALEQHVNSGAHSAKSYRCDDCNKEFSSLTALMGHCESTRCVYANNIVHTLANDYERGPQLMLTNGSTYTEATLEFDGSAKPNPGNGGAGYVLYDGSGSVLESTSVEIIDGYITSNQAEYAALVWGMECAVRYNIKSLLVKGDSELVIGQMNGDKNVNSERIKPMYKQANYLEESSFRRVRYEHIYRGENSAADQLANEGSNCYADEQKHLSEAKY
uniref:RNase H type-1 domain-containing protein n=1 Tax=Chaetoceros debilis TaxID=122233 RepID=A0A7S3VGH0_9STRA|mmetsp:Transcript_6280/g.9199  ORF Transcript_6280/g.9199 Transcript_6280/m.9199 type:complete len:303 (+) Transcript_6280:89-997(+)